MKKFILIVAKVIHLMKHNVHFILGDSASKAAKQEGCDLVYTLKVRRSFFELYFTVIFGKKYCIWINRNTALVTTYTVC